MTHSRPALQDRQYRRYYEMVFDGTQSYDDWMRRNRLAFRALNPSVTDDQEPAAFQFWMMETYEGQFALA